MCAIVHSTRQSIFHQWFAPIVLSFPALTGKKTNVFSSVTRLILADAEGIRSSVNCVATGKTPAPAKTGGHLFDERTIPNGKRLRSQRFIRNRATRNLFANPTFAVKKIECWDATTYVCSGTTLSRIGSQTGRSCALPAGGPDQLPAGSK
jgi:hypothetical protein